MSLKPGEQITFPGVTVRRNVIQHGDTLTFEGRPFRFHGPVWCRVWDWLRGRDLEEVKPLKTFVVTSVGPDPDHQADALAYAMAASRHLEFPIFIGIDWAADEE